MRGRVTLLDISVFAAINTTTAAVMLNEVKHLEPTKMVFSQLFNQFLHFVQDDKFGMGVGVLNK